MGMTKMFISKPSLKLICDDLHNLAHWLIKNFTNYGFQQIQLNKKSSKTAENRESLAKGPDDFQDYLAAKATLEATWQQLINPLSQYETQMQSGDLIALTSYMNDQQTPAAIIQVVTNHYILKELKSFWIPYLYLYQMILWLLPRTTWVLLVGRTWAICTSPLISCLSKYLSGTKLDNTGVDMQKWSLQTQFH